jgi:leucyl-tRNA synthetase
MRDAIFARQRYWGEPIPLKHDKNGLIEPLKDKELPLKLPEVRSYQPTGTGEGPLAGVSAWTKKGLETNTMPGWAGSSWYFLRYMDPKNKRALADRKALNYWKDVDMYVGGAEHATGHLLYARFWHKFLKDIGVVPTEEPFLALKNQGLILGPDGRKMSKRWGNTINPDDIVDSYGADTLRLYEMFMGPFEASLPWNPDSIIGSRRFLDRIFRMQKRVSKKAVSSPRLENLLHRTVEKVGKDIDSFAFNTAVSAMMILLNEFDKTQEINRKDFEMLLKILCPFAPHMTEEIWQKLGHSSLLVSESWPKANKAKMKELEVNIAVQINSKVRAQMLVETGAKEEDVVEQAKNLEDVAKWLIGKEIRKVVYIKDKLLNLVVF